MHFHNLGLSMELSRAITQDRLLEATRARALRGLLAIEGETRRGLRHSAGLALIRLGLRLSRDASIRRPSAAHID